MKKAVFDLKNPQKTMFKQDWGNSNYYFILETGKIYLVKGTNINEGAAGPGTIIYTDLNNPGANVNYAQFTGDWNSTILSKITGVKKIVPGNFGSDSIALLENGTLTGWGTGQSWQTQLFNSTAFRNINNIKDIGTSMITPLFLLTNNGAFTGINLGWPGPDYFSGLYGNGPIFTNIKSILDTQNLYGTFLLKNNDDLIYINEQGGTNSEFANQFLTLNDRLFTGIVAKNVKKIVSNGPNLDDTIILYNNGTLSGLWGSSFNNTYQTRLAPLNGTIIDFWTDQTASNLTLRLNDNKITGYGYFWSQGFMNDFVNNDIIDIEAYSSIPIGIALGEPGPSSSSSSSSSSQPVSSSSSSSSLNSSFPYLKIKDGIDPETELGISKQIAIIETYRNKSLILDLNKIILNFYLKNSSDYFCKNYPFLEILSVSNLPNNVFYRKQDAFKGWLEGYPTLVGNYSIYILIRDLVCNKVCERYITLKIKDPKDSNQTYLTKKSNAKYIGFTKMNDRSVIKEKIIGKNNRIWFRSKSVTNITFNVSIYSGKTLVIKDWNSKILIFEKTNDILYDPITVTLPVDPNIDPLNKNIFIYNTSNIKTLDLRNNTVTDFDFFGTINNIEQLLI